jgi:hypothetical protein
MHRVRGLYSTAERARVLGVFKYSEDQLAEFLGLWRQGGHLSPAQIEALSEWDQTPDDVREALRPKIEEERGRAAATAPAPLTPAEVEYGRQQGLVSRPLGERVVAAVRRVFSPKR